MLKLWNSNTKSQVSSRRFFMYCPCLYGLKASPVRLKKKTLKTTNFCQQISNYSYETTPGPAWCWFWFWGLNCPWPCPPLYDGASCGGLPGALWGVLLRVCILWFPGVLGLSPVDGWPPAGTFSSSIPSRVKSQSSGSSAEKTDQWILSEAGFFTTLSKYVEPSGGGLHHLGNILPCCKASFVQLRCCHSTLELLPDLEEFRKTHLNS